MKRLEAGAGVVELKIGLGSKISLEGLSLFSDSDAFLFGLGLVKLNIFDQGQISWTQPVLHYIFFALVFPFSLADAAALVNARHFHFFADILSGTSHKIIRVWIE